ncbi:MAG: hypothetical protein H0U53_02090 [Actinobacteria bacterium]|nr:hypothetical protein [Actinomycetota bacterium]
MKHQAIVTNWAVNEPPQHVYVDHGPSSAVQHAKSLPSILAGGGSILTGTKAPPSMDALHGAGRMRS